MSIVRRGVVRSAWACGMALWLAALAGPAEAAGEQLLYYVSGDQIVFTNLPRHDARRVPGVIPAERLRSGTALPSTDYDPFIENVAGEFALDPALIKAVALVESNFNPRAVSPKGAQGLMQLMPATARAYGVQDPHDPYQNLRAGANHLRNLLDEFGGNVTLALAAYNAGSGAVRRYGGVPNYRETRNYVRKIEGHLGSRGSSRVPRRMVAVASPHPVTVELQADGSVSLSN